MGSQSAHSYLSKMSFICDRHRECEGKKSFCNFVVDWLITGTALRVLIEMHF